MESEKFEMVAKTFQGLEDVLSDELTELGAEDVQTGRRMVSFRGDLRMMYRANLCLRTALRILKPIAKFTAADPDQLYDFVREFDWDRYLTPEKTFAIDSTVNSAEFTHSKFVTYRVKDGIADYFNDKYGRRPSIRLNGADLELNVHILGERVTISLDSSGEPLSRRGYRTVHTEAPINEALAAGLILKTGWRGETDLIDPMCGSGTFLIEGALIAAGINPGIFRTRFAFETWPDFDSALFEELYNDDSGERVPSCRIYGGDIAREAVETALKNIHSAGVEEWVSVECKPMADWTEPPIEGMLITNPPYGERLRPGDIEGLYKQIGHTLKHYFQGYHAWILGYKDEHFREIGLKPSQKIPVLNGKLECEMREYLLFDGSYAGFRAQGGSVGADDKPRTTKKKVKHLSDGEWKAETRAFAPSRKPQADKRARQERQERREFRSDRRPDPKSFRGERKERRDSYDRHERRESYERRDRQNSPIAGIKNRQPGISDEHEVRFDTRKAPVMRSRKGWKKEEK